MLYRVSFALKCTVTIRDFASCTFDCLSSYRILLFIESILVKRHASSPFFQTCQSSSFTNTASQHSSHGTRSFIKSTVITKIQFVQPLLLHILGKHFTVLILNITQLMRRGGKLVHPDVYLLVLLVHKLRKVEGDCLTAHFGKRTICSQLYPLVAGFKSVVKVPTNLSPLSWSVKTLYRTEQRGGKNKNLWKQKKTWIY